MEDMAFLGVLERRYFTHHTLLFPQQSVKHTQNESRNTEPVSPVDRSIRTHNQPCFLHTDTQSIINIASTCPQSKTTYRQYRPNQA